VRSHYESAAKIAERLDFSQGLATALIDRGEFEASLGNQRQALSFFDRAVAYVRRSKADAHLGFCLANRARALLATGDAAAALQNAREAVEIAERLPLPRLSAWARLTLGGVAVAGGDYEIGLALMRNAIETRREIGDVQGLCKALAEYVDALWGLDRIAEASSAVDELARLYEDHAEQIQWALRICFVLARAARQRGDDTAAEACARQGFDLLQRELELIDDEETRRLYADLPWNRALAEMGRSSDRKKSNAKKGRVFPLKS